MSEKEKADMEKKVELLEWKIKILEQKLNEYDEFIDDVFKLVKKHRKLKFRNITRG